MSTKHTHVRSEKNRSYRGLPHKYSIKVKTNCLKMLLYGETFSLSRRDELESLKSKKVIWRKLQDQKQT